MDDFRAKRLHAYKGSNSEIKCPDVTIPKK